MRQNWKIDGIVRIFLNPSRVICTLMLCILSVHDFRFMLNAHVKGKEIVQVRWFVSKAEEFTHSPSWSQSGSSLAPLTKIGHNWSCRDVVNIWLFLWNVNFHPVLPRNILQQSQSKPHTHIQNISPRHNISLQIYSERHNRCVWFYIAVILQNAEFAFWFLF